MDGVLRLVDKGVVTGSCAGGASTIVTALDGGTVTTARADVDTVVTEHGVAHLRGCPLPERAGRLVAIAAPQHREQLSRGMRMFEPTIITAPVHAAPPAEEHSS